MKKSLWCIYTKKKKKIVIHVALLSQSQTDSVYNMSWKEELDDDLKMARWKENFAMLYLRLFVVLSACYCGEEKRKKVNFYQIYKR